MVVRTTLLAAVLLAGCGPGQLGEETDPQLGLEPPQLELTDDDVWFDGPWTHIEGTATDDDQPPWTLDVTLYSDVDGDLWQGHPEADGSWAWIGALSEGHHLIEAMVEDADDNAASAVFELDVAVLNRPPSCAIVHPANAASFDSGTSIFFMGKSEDRDGDEVLLTWRSSLSGPMFLGDSWDQAIQDGNHTIRLEGIDEHGARCADEINVYVGI